MEVERGDRADAGGAPPPPERRGGRRPVPTRLLVLGLVLLGVGPSASALVEVVVFGRQAVPGLVAVAPLIVLSLATAALVWWSGRPWTRVAGILVGVLHLLSSGRFIVENLGYAHSVLDFMPLLTVATGAVYAIAFGTATLTPGRRARAGADLFERRVVVGTVLALVVATLGSTAMTAAGAERVDEAAARFAVPVDAVSFRFEPRVIEASGDVRLLVHNSDPVLHTFTIPALDIDRVVLPGSDVLVELRGVDPGTFTIYCKPHADEAMADPELAGMAATLVVR